MGISGVDKIHIEVNRIFELQKRSRYKISNTSAQQRIEKLKKLLNWIYLNKEKIRLAIYSDFNKPAAEVDLTEIWIAISEIKHAVKYLKGWMKPHRVKKRLALLTTSAKIKYEAKGLVLIISPWNFPFNLALSPLISAIAAGNCIILKPSEFSPNTSSLLSEMIKAVSQEDEIAVMLGNKNVAIELLKKPFDHIFFTGSSEKGKMVMKAAVENLTSLTLELGGKSPVLVDNTADIKDASEKIVWGKFMNSGQSCVAPDYLLLPENIYVEFLKALKEATNKLYGNSESERRSSKDFARIINKTHFSRLENMVNESVKAGAAINEGGIGEELERYIAPTIISNVRTDSSIMTEEIFGPILPIVTYNSLDEAIQIINSKELPLTLYIFSNSKKNIERIISSTSSGSCCINEIALHYAHLNLPFGGTGYSGFGKAHGYFGFKSFSNERAILKNIRLSPMKFLYPPYTSRVQKLIDLLLRYL